MNEKKRQRLTASEKSPELEKVFKRKLWRFILNAHLFLWTFFAEDAVGGRLKAIRLTLSGHTS